MLKTLFFTALQTYYPKLKLSFGDLTKTMTRSRKVNAFQPYTMFLKNYYLAIIIKITKCFQKINVSVLGLERRSSPDPEFRNQTRYHSTISRMHGSGI